MHTVFISNRFIVSRCGGTINDDVSSVPHSSVVECIMRMFRSGMRPRLVGEVSLIISYDLKSTEKFLEYLVEMGDLRQCEPHESLVLWGRSGLVMYALINSDNLSVLKQH